MQSKYKAHIAVGLANLIYSINFIVMKNITPTVVGPFALNMLRVVGATILFWILYVTKPSKQVFSKQDWKNLIICAVTGIIINQILFVKGVALTTPFRASLLMLFCPIAVVFFALYFQKQPITKNRIIGLLLGIIGAAILVSLREKTQVGENHLLGDSFIVINALSYAFYLVWVKKLTAHHNDLVVLRWVFTIAAIAMLPFGYSDMVAVDWTTISTMNIFAIAFIVVGVTFATYLLNAYSIRIIGSSATGAYIYTQPFFASTLFVYLTGNTDYLPVKIIAALFIFVGLYYVSFKKENSSKS